MKRLFVLTAAVLAFACAASAQTASEIVARMDQELAKCDVEGYSFTFDMKIPFLATSSTRISTLGDKERMDMTYKDENKVIWRDKDTTWTYDNGEVVIALEPRKEDSDDNATFKNLSGRYDVSIKSETADVWELLCKKSKSNKDKNDLKKMVFSVSKKTFLPVEYSNKKAGFKMDIRDYAVGVSEDFVTFTPDKVNGAPITDKR